MGIDWQGFRIDSYEAGLARSGPHGAADVVFSIFGDVPEPITLALLGIALPGLILAKRRHRLSNARFARPRG
jgi:hypothetical protein